MAPLSGADLGFESSNFNCRGDHMRVDYWWLTKTAATVAGFLVLLAGVSGTAMANFQVAPEIDPGSMANGLLVLSGAWLMLNGRRPRK